MASVAAETKVKVYWATTVASTSAPTVANISAATNISSFIMKDGVNISLSQNMVDTATIADLFETQAVGSYGGTIELTMKRDDASDTAWNLWVYGTNGFLIVSRYGTPITSSKVEVYPAQMHQPVPIQPAGNEVQKFTGMAAITADPALKATVAA